MIVYENRTTFGTYRGPHAGEPHADHPKRPDGDDWYQIGSTVATIDGLLIWTWQRSRTVSDAAPLPEPLPEPKPAPTKAPRYRPGT